MSCGFRSHLFEQSIHTRWIVKLCQVPQIFYAYEYNLKGWFQPFVLVLTASTLCCASKHICYKDGSLSSPVFLIGFICVCMCMHVHHAEVREQLSGVDSHLHLFLRQSLSCCFCVALDPPD